MTGTTERRHDHAARDPRRRRTWILVAVLVSVGLVAARSFTESSGVSLPDRLQDLVTLSASVLIESLPFVILGIVLSIVVQVFVPDSVIMRVLPRNGALRRLVLSLFGIGLPVCECGNVPLARGLVMKGLTVPESMTFLLAAPIVNPITIITTHQAFGFDDGILVARILGGIAIANLVGWLFSRHPAQHELITPGFAAACERPHGPQAGEPRWRSAVDVFTRETSVIMPALFVGALLAGAIQVAVPRNVLVALGSDPIWSVLAMMLLAFVISICSSVDAFFILPFASVFLPGSIVAFLVFGPIIDIKMLAILRTTFPTRVLVQLSVVVALASALIGAAVNVFA